MHSDRFIRVLEYVEDHLTEKITLADLAEVACMSKFNFARTFKAEVGEAPMHYLARCRVDAACRLLAGTKKPLAMVATAAGYSSQSHMSTAFKKATGVSPAVYRRQS